MQRKSVPLLIKNADDDPGAFTGLASVFDNLDQEVGQNRDHRCHGIHCLRPWQKAGLAPKMPLSNSRKEACHARNKITNHHRAPTSAKMTGPQPAVTVLTQASRQESAWPVLTLRAELHPLGRANDNDIAGGGGRKRPLVLVGGPAGTRSTLMYSFRRRTRDAELSRLRAENAEMRSRIGRLVEEKAVLRDRLEEMSSFKHTPLRLPGTW
jgi:hypothetical protein